MTDNGETDIEVKIEALCSFLQAENVGNFQSLQNVLSGLCTHTVTLEKRKVGISASRVLRGTDY